MRDNLDQDEAKIAKLEEVAEQRHLRDQAELQSIINTEGGRFFLWRLMAVTGAFHTNHPDDQLSMAFREGRRSIGLWLLAELEATDPNGFAKVRQEAAKRKAEDDLLKQQIWDSDD